MNVAAAPDEDLLQRVARAIAAAVLNSQSDLDDGPKRPVMADRRRAAEEAATAALAAIEPGDDLGNGLIAVLRPTEA
ncbi:hypothetical protein [Aurantimonas sp. VKM B-3413]|uniref:hypothetical protein n=1 Tax=Aurantimonas sp. VKM B-3413 TaxID=2779401 RepID=UPI001E33EBD2|nr:hypothetical protein [Aurantimonas sp. VKM B-3413]MCB8837973.1 hypothetical protein [Aurantimonas sp. VKM B-3413]